MTKQFEFADFVDEFSVPFTLFEEAGEGERLPNGKWQNAPATPIPKQGIILPLTEDDRRYVANGTFTQRDRKLYTKEPLQEGAKIEYKNVKYTIQAFKDYEAYADVYIYIARGADK
jgi:hypothetical protein